MAVIGAVVMLAVALSGHFSPLAFAFTLASIGLGNGIAVPAAFAGAVGSIPRIAGTASGLSGFLQFAFAAAVNPLAGLVSHGSLLELAAIFFALLRAGCGDLPNSRWPAPTWRLYRWCIAHINRNTGILTDEARADGYGLPRRQQAPRQGSVGKPLPGTSHRWAVTNRSASSSVTTLQLPDRQRVDVLPPSRS